MILIKYLLCISCAYIFIEGAVIKDSKKCDISDGVCKKKMFQNIYKEVTESRNMDIPTLDPIKIDYAVLNLPNSVKIKIENELVTGLKNCTFDKLETFFDGPMISQLDIICNMEIDSDSVIEIPKKVYKDIGGGDIDNELVFGKGKLKITTENLHFRLSIPFDFKLQDNEIYLVTKSPKIKLLTHDKSALTIEDLNVDDNLNNEGLLKYLKDNTEELNIIPPVIAKILEYFNILTVSYLSKLPATKLYSSDLSNL